MTRKLAFFEAMTTFKTALSRATNAWGIRERQVAGYGVKISKNKKKDL